MDRKVVRNKDRLIESQKDIFIARQIYICIDTQKDKYIDGLIGRQKYRLIDR